jgi:hypothetical protein
LQLRNQVSPSVFLHFVYGPVFFLQSWLKRQRGKIDLHIYFTVAFHFSCIARYDHIFHSVFKPRIGSYSHHLGFLGGGAAVQRANFRCEKKFHDIEEFFNFLIFCVLILPLKSCI